MFDAVRNNKKIVQGILALIILPFAFWGVESYVSGVGPGNDVATVGESKISTYQFEQAWREQMDRMRQQLGANFKQELFDTPEARMAVVNSLVDQRLLMLEALKGHLGASNALLVEVIGSMPALQEDGKFSQSRYEAALRAQGMTPEQFEAQLRQDLTMQQLVGAFTDAGIVAQASAEMLLKIKSEERKVSELRLTPDQFVGEVKLEANAARKYYDENQKVFQTPELVWAEYVSLSLEGLLAQVSVSEAEVKQWYESHKQSYQQPEERRASHILITVDASASESDKAKAKSKAEALLAEVQKSPARFSELAKANSQDPGSAANGGDLGFFGRGMMVPPFEQAVFALQQDEISALVQSDFGFHIIKLTGIKPGKQKSLDEVRAEIEGELKRQAAQRRFAEAAEAFTNIVYEQPDSLAPVAEKFKLKIQKSEPIPKNPPTQVLSALGPLGNEKILTALFSEDAIKLKRNTDAVEVAQNTLVSARVAEHQPAAVRPFESVSAEIEQMLKIKEAAALAKLRGEAKLAELMAGQDKTNWIQAKTVTRQGRQQLSAAALQTIFRADTEKLPSYAGVELPEGGGYAIFKIISVKALEKIDENKLQALQESYAAMVAREDFAAYLSGLRQRYKVEINKSVVNAKER
ncbi:MAG: SurA N-terminal domain-containing protein [Zoogloeaceae bacterium]|nr:SurA N-terminal domain-containing protein [Zoogloeaceae bacterium]